MCPEALAYPKLPCRWEPIARSSAWCGAKNALLVRSRAELKILRFVLFHSPVHQPRPERNQRGHKQQSSSPQWPSRNNRGVNQHHTKSQPQPAVHRPHNPHRHRVFPNIFQRHRKEQQRQKRTPFNQRRCPQHSNRIFHSFRRREDECSSSFCQSKRLIIMPIAILFFLLLILISSSL